MARTTSPGSVAALLMLGSAALVPPSGVRADDGKPRVAPAYTLPTKADQYEFRPGRDELFVRLDREIQAIPFKDAKARPVIKNTDVNVDGGTNFFAFRSPTRLLTVGTRIRLWDIDRPDEPPADIDPAAHEGPRHLYLIAVPLNALTEKAGYRDVFAVSDRDHLNVGRTLLFDLSKADGVTGGQSRFGIGGIALSPDGERFARGGADWRVVCYRGGANAPAWTADHDRDVRWLAFSPDGTMLAACGRKAVTVYSAKTGGQLARREDCGGQCVAFLGDAGWFAATSADRMVVQHIRQDGRLTVEAGGHLAVSPDGTHVAARVSKDAVGVWRAADLIAAANGGKK